ncbi:hypothetical protein HPB47_016456 [Ixodes persulcatus]|uniref:Uncharacterized protein n=1 Tax=Ixodes persulcatus TaxID=34615 RepID=A0AC60QUG6_IXOPE|nr:hypothetical protein HPB47_016456 [Ixodes persulcatus]
MLHSSSRRSDTHGSIQGLCGAKPMLPLQRQGRTCEPQLWPRKQTRQMSSADPGVTFVFLSNQRLNYPLVEIRAMDERSAACSPETL